MSAPTRLIENNTYALGRDAAFASNLRGYKGIVGGYLAGPTAVNAWSEGDWQMFGGNYKLPFWPAGNAGEPEAMNCVQQLIRLGVPRGKTVVVDMETRVDVTYLNNFFRVMHHVGYYVWVYGSASSVFGNPQCNGYEVADWSGQEFMYPHPAVRATQYESEPNHKQYDDFCVKWWEIDNGRLWR